MCENVINENIWGKWKKKGKTSPGWSLSLHKCIQCAQKSLLPTSPFSISLSISNVTTNSTTYLYTCLYVQLALTVNNIFVKGKWLSKKEKCFHITNPLLWHFQLLIMRPQKICYFYTFRNKIKHQMITR